MRGRLSTISSRFWSWTLQQRPAPALQSFEWVQEKALIFSVFGVTGTTAVFCVRPLLSKAGIEGSLREGPWSYRIASLFVVSPAYSVLLVTFGTLAGRHAYFGKFSSRILSRFGPPGRSIERALCQRQALQRSH